MTLHQYLAALRQYWIMIVSLTVAGTVIGVVLASLLPDQYRSTASVMIVAERGENSAELVQGSNYVQSLVQSYSTLVTKPIVLQPVIDDLGLTETPYQLASAITVTAPLDTVVIDISVVDRDPTKARDIADSVVTSLGAAVTELSPTGVDERPAVRTAIVAPARLPGAPFAPDVRTYGIIGALAGLGIGVIYALVRRLAGGRITDAEDIAEELDVPVLGEIGVAPRSKSMARSLLVHPNGRIAEAQRALAANLRFADVDNDLGVLLLTSPSSGDGKSSVALGLALALAESGKKVLLIDADLRRPAVARLTRLEGAVGMTTVVLGETSLEDARMTWGLPGLDLLTSGEIPPNPGRLLSTGRLKSLITEARESYDLVILDSPPVLAVTDALWLAPLADAVIVIARAGRTTRRALSRAISAIRSSRRDVVGVVLNGLKSRQRTPYYNEGRVRDGAPPPTDQYDAIALPGTSRPHHHELRSTDARTAPDRTPQDPSIEPRTRSTIPPA